MLSTVIIYLSLLFQMLAAGIAISLFKRTKFNVSWILITTGFLLMFVSRVVELIPTIDSDGAVELAIFQRWLSFMISLVLLVGVFYIRKIFQFMRRLDELRSETEKKILSAVIKTEEEERQRFAKELHDGLGPLLSVVKMLVSGLDVNKKTDINEKIKQNLKQAVDEAIVSVRDISANISPHILNNFGLKVAIESFIKKLYMNEGMDIRFTANVGDHRFTYNVEVIMYRVMCELINNTLRHAVASKIWIDLHLDDEVLYLEYQDNGIGFDMAVLSSNKGMGLTNMQYRLKSGNGDITITSQRGKGMRANAYLKL